MLIDESALAVGGMHLQPSEEDNEGDDAWWEQLEYLYVITFQGAGAQHPPLLGARHAVFENSKPNLHRTRHTL